VGSGGKPVGPVSPIVPVTVSVAHGQLKAVEVTDAKTHQPVPGVLDPDGLAWHSGAEAMRSDRRRQNALHDIDWMVVPIVFEDVRYCPWEFVARINGQLRRAQAA